MSAVLTRELTPSEATSPARQGRGRSRLARAGLGVALAAPVLAYLWVALHRVGYPYELDWMEGGSVELAARVAAGHSLYAAPSLAFVGWTYPPLYYWVSAAVASVTGIGFVPLRLVSLLASLAVMGTLASIVINETRDRLAGLISAGLFALTFQASGAWLDTGRVDSLFLALTLLALACGRRARTVRGGIALGLLAFLAFFTKQTAIVAVLPALLYLALVRRRVGVPALATLLVALAGSTLLLDALSDGWYRYYVFSELTSQPWAQQVWVSFWTQDVWRHQWPLLILLAGGTMAATWTARHRLSTTSPALYHAAAAAGLIASAWLSRLHTGGYANVLMPAYAALALLAGLSFAALARGRAARVTAPLAGVALLAQLAVLAYPLSAQIPTAADRGAGAALIARLRTLPGPVIVLRHPWYATLAGKGDSAAQQEAIHDVLRSGAPRGARALQASLPNALDAEGVQAVVLDYAGDGELFGHALAREFQLQKAPITASALYPLTDLRTAPVLLYVRVRGPHATRSASGSAVASATPEPGAARR